jgi:methyl coenzyme M reductase gamma subunit
MSACRVVCALQHPADVGLELLPAADLDRRAVIRIAELPLRDDMVLISVVRRVHACYAPGGLFRLRVHGAV